jgi:hypothetical protein
VIQIISDVDITYTTESNRNVREYKYVSLPAESSVTPVGYFNVALVAWPLSPLKVVDPVPATVVIIPVDIVTLRMR